jgi:uncharacterized protein
MSLQFNISQLLKLGVGFTREYPISSDDSIVLSDEATATDVRGSARFMVTNYEVIASGHATATLQQTCARCIEPFEAKSSIEFNEEYQPTIDITTGLPSREPASDTAFRVSQSHMIDLTEAIRQNLVVAMDIIPVCRQDCQGLCPTCGVNRNLETCHCPAIVESGPFDALQGLLSDSTTNQ